MTCLICNQDDHTTDEHRERLESLGINEYCPCCGESECECYFVDNELGTGQECVVHQQ